MARIERVIDGHKSAINVARFTYDGRYCLTAGDDRKVCLWNPFKSDATESIEGKKKALNIKTYSGLHGYSILDLAVSRDNSRFASCGVDKTVFYCDVTTGNALRRIQGHSHRINAIAFNEDCSILLTASYDKTVALWDLKSAAREPIQVLDDFHCSYDCDGADS